MMPLKSQADMDLYGYVVCEIIGCEEKANKVFMVQARYIELCDHHHEDVTNMSYIS